MLFSDFVWRVCQKFLILVILYWFGGKLIKNKNPEAELQGPIYLEIGSSELPIVWLALIIIEYDNIFYNEA